MLFNNSVCITLMMVAALFGLATAVPTTSERCSPILPPPIPNCRAGALSPNVSRGLEAVIRDSLSAAHDSMTYIKDNAACQPDYLRLNEVSNMVNVPMMIYCQCKF